MNALKNFFMRGDYMNMQKNMMKYTAIICLSALLFGCTEPELIVDDGPGMAYYDADKRTEYANALDFDNYEGQPYFAAAFLGYGDMMDFRNAYIKDIFDSLPEEKIKKTAHFDCEGDEWYLIVPRYKEDVYITNLDTGEVRTVEDGDAFTVKCNLSDIYPNIEISTEMNYGAYKFSPQVGGDGCLVTNTDVCDITDYPVSDEELSIQ